jgi:phospholipase/carboxylesterase
MIDLFMAALLKTIELETQANPQYAVIWLHGLGASADDFVPVIPELKIPNSHAIRFIFPDAPQIPVTINAGYVMPAWYDILELSSISRKVDKAGIDKSVQQIGQLIEREKQRGILSSNIFLAGFSQGGAIAYQTALTYQERLGGVIALSTYVPDPIDLKQRFNPLNRDLPVMVAHGIYDGVVSTQLGLQAFDLVKDLGCDTVWHEYPMEHQVCLEEIQDIREWLLSQINA